jgi:hypothetical protein
MTATLRLCDGIDFPHATVTPNCVTTAPSSVENGTSLVADKTQPAPKRAISVRQPWAWAIVHAGKDVENRSRRDPWRSAVGERILIHAAKTPEPGDEATVAQLAGLPEPADRHASLLPVEAATLGALIGEALVANVHNADECGAHYKWVRFCSPWAQPDQWHIVLDDVTALPSPRAWRGALGLFEVTG